MKAIRISLYISAILVMACGYLPSGAKSESNTSILHSGTDHNSAVLPDAEATPKPGGAGDRKNLLAIGNGAFVVEKSSEAALNWRAINIIDELASVGWASAKREVANQQLVIELPAKTTLRSVVFDTASVDTNQSSAKDITLEISDASATSGFQQILATTLKDAKDGQEFPISQPVAGRWLRLSVKSNFGSTDYVEIMDIRGFGDQEPLAALENVSGTYESRFGVFHVKQEGTSITGCYETNGGEIRGGIENRVMTLTWKEIGSSHSGPALMVFSADGKQFRGAYGRDTIDNGFFGEWGGKKISDKVGNCPGSKTMIDTPDAAKNHIGTELKEKGRAIIYGINFDTNSDVIKPESKSTLDQIAAVLTESKEWKMTVEGHTDSIGGEAFNKTLSQKRSSSVKAYLIGKGITATRLTPTGMGLSKPVASNETAAGRARNRRVELVKN